MNKYQEAYKEIDKFFCYEMNDGTSFEEYLNIDELAMEHIKELVDKETPMKPTLKRGIYDIRCSMCGNPNLNTKWTYGRYCSGCGQRIDWSNEE